MQSHAMEDPHRPWSRREMRECLTDPALARTLWASGSRTASSLRREFGGSEKSFLAFVSSLFTRDPHAPEHARLAWSAYEETGADTEMVDGKA